MTPTSSGSAPRARALKRGRRFPRWVLWCLGLLIVVVAALQVEVLAGLLPPSASELFVKVAGIGTFFGAAALCAARVFHHRGERLVWGLFALGLGSWAVGNVYFTLAISNTEEIPVPSLADAGFLGFYPPVFIALALLVRQRISKDAGAAVWLDGLTGALAASAVAAAVIFEAVLSSAGGPPVLVATNLAYPIADLLLAALLVMAVIVARERLTGSWLCLAGGLAAFTLSDSLYLLESAAGTYELGAWYDLGWYLGGALIALGAWWPAAERSRAHPENWGTVVLPVSWAGVGLAVLLVSNFQSVNLLALALATASIVTVFGRLVLTVADNLAMLRRSRREALTDSLTGLRNRRQLMRDLEAGLNAQGTQTQHRVLALFDLDGFKRYNDRFGHPAGDALLRRLAGALAKVTAEHGRSYRIGGDEFCALLELDGPDALLACEEMARALCEEGAGFTIRCSYGWGAIPREAPTAETALRLVDQRLYANKRSQSGPSAGLQSSNVLLQTLVERDATLAHHVRDVAEYAEATARRLGLTAAELEDIRLAAELHDIGKVAIPEAILKKPGPLSEAEWELMRTHTLVGQRITTAAPDLARVGEIIRSSHERADGTGYPDGLSADDIPLPARIISICDAYDAMVQNRPYRKALSSNAAIATLRRCSGTQFDPKVVDAFAATIASQEGAPPRAAARTNGSSPQVPSALADVER